MEPGVESPHSWRYLQGRESAITRSPRWSHDGRELYFTDLNQKVFAVDVSLGSTFSAGVPHLLHEGHYKGQANGNTSFDVSKSGF